MKIEELYEKHDAKMQTVQDLAVVTPVEKSLEQKMQDLQSGSEAPDDERAKVLAAQELARSVMLDEMR